MKKKALFISGGWEGHEPIETSEYISEQITKFDIESQIVNDLEVMSDLDLSLIHISEPTRPY